MTGLEHHELAGSLPTRVFISYAHEQDGGRHREVVRALWLFLREHGLDAHADFAVQDRVDWASWMDEQIQAADHILVIASPAYRVRAAGAAGPDDGQGVQWEARQIKNVYYANQHALNRFVPVILPGQAMTGLPGFLSPNITTVYTVHEFTVAGAEPLLRLLTNQPAELVPKLGAPPRLPPRAMTPLQRRVPESDAGAPVAGDNFAPAHLAERRLGTDLSTHQLPPDAGDFTGREAELAALRAIVGEQHTGPMVINLYGPPGVGKSALGLRFAHLLGPGYPSAQLYVNVGDGPTDIGAREILLSLMAAVGRPADPDAEPGQLRTTYLGMFHDAIWLLLLDNVRYASQVRALVPNSDKCLVLATSRTPLADWEGVRLFPVPMLDQTAATELFHAISGRVIDDDAGRLARLCGGLPLAIRITAAIAKKRPYWSLNRLVAELTDEKTRLAALHEGDLDVRASFELSYRTIDPADQRAFRMATLAPHVDLTAAELAVLLSCGESSAQHALDRITDAQLLSTDDGEHFQFHDLIALFACHLRDTAERPDTIRAARDRLLIKLAETFVTEYGAAVRTKRWIFGEGMARWYSRHAEADIESVFVPRRLAATAQPDQVLTWDEVRTRSARALIIGGAGTGKTTLLEWDCWRAVDRGGITLSVPVRRFRSGDTIEQLVCGSVEYRFGVRLAVPVLRRLLRAGDSAVYFDSIDELPKDLRAACLTAIQDFCDRNADVAVVVTSRRDASLERTGLPGFTTYELANFSPDDVHRLVRGWIGTDQPGRLLQELAAIADDTAWLANPLMLSWSLATYRERGTLPHSELDLHQATFDMTIGARDTSRGITRAATPPGLMVRSIELTALWFKSKEHRIRGVLEAELVDYLAIELRINPYELISVLTDQVGLAYRSGSNEAGTALITLTQDSFGEYVAARGLTEVAHSPDDFARWIVALVAVGRFDSGWHYAVELYHRSGHDSDLTDLIHRAALDYDGSDAHRVHEVLGLPFA